MKASQDAETEAQVFHKKSRNRAGLVSWGFNKKKAPLDIVGPKRRTKATKMTAREDAKKPKQEST